MLRQPLLLLTLLLHLLLLRPLLLLTLLHLLLLRPPLLLLTLLLLQLLRPPLLLLTQQSRKKRSSNSLQLLRKKPTFGSAFCFLSPAYR